MAERAARTSRPYAFEQMTRMVHETHSEWALYWGVMSIPEILKQIDAEIARLKQVRHILAGETPTPKPKAKRTLSARRAGRSAKLSVGVGQQRRLQWSPF